MAKKSKVSEYEAESRKLNNSSRPKTAYERIVFKVLEDDDQEAALLVDYMRGGSPLVINFESLDEMTINKMLSFFAGATYACDGECIEIKEKVYMFAKKVDFLDGTLRSFLESL